MDHLAVVQLPIDEETDVLAVDALGEIVLHKVARRGHDKVLIKKGISVSNTVHSSGKTALHTTAKERHEVISRLGGKVAMIPFYSRMGVILL